MKILDDTPDRLVVQGTTILAEMSRGCLVLALLPLGLAALMGMTALTQWGMNSGTLSPWVVLAAPGVAVGLLVFWSLRPKPAVKPRRCQPSPGARVATFDAIAGVVEISGLGTFPLSRVREAVLESDEDAGYNVSLRFHDQRAVSLSQVYIGDRERMQRVVDAIKVFLARLRQHESEMETSLKPIATGPSVQEARTKEEFEQALAATREQADQARRASLKS
jgi:hypothetical protein